MSKNFAPQVLFTLVGITADGTVVPVQYDPDVGYYTRSVGALENRGYQMTPQVFLHDTTYRTLVEKFKPNEAYYPGVVRLEIREYRFV